MTGAYFNFSLVFQVYRSEDGLRWVETCLVMKYNNEDVLTAAKCLIFLSDTQNARWHHTLRMYTECWWRKQKGKDHYEEQEKTTRETKVKVRQCTSR